MIDRRQARILAMQALCQLEVLADEFLPQLDEFLTEESRERAVQGYARRLVEEVWRDREIIDQRIQSVAEHWDLKRMATVDRNALRVAVCELMHHPDVPPIVAVNEAVEIGKTFGTTESAAFINGLLDAILRKPSPSPETTTADLPPASPAEAP